MTDPYAYKLGYIKSDARIVAYDLAVALKRNRDREGLRAAIERAIKQLRSSEDRAEESYRQSEASATTEARVGV